MNKEEIIYKVIIEREAAPMLSPFKFYWEVNVYRITDGQWYKDYKLSYTGISPSEKAARYWAMRRILKVQKYIGSGTEFGVVFTSEGDATSVISMLKKND